MADNSALLLRATDKLRFVPDGLTGDAAALTVRAWDQTSGTAGTKVDAGVNGGATAFSSAVETVSITVTAGNDAPVNNVPGAQSTPEDTPLVFSSITGNLISISDVDAGSGAVQVSLTSTNGTITLAGTTGLTFTIGDGTNDATMTFTGTITNINATLNGLAFTPTASFNGAASLQIITDDQGNTGVGGALSDTDTVAITINAVNDAPVLSTDTGSTVVQGGTDLIEATEPAVTDPDNTAAELTYTVTSTPANGRLELISAPGITITSFTQAQIDAGQVRYVHNGSGTASDQFTFTVSDGVGGLISPIPFAITVDLAPMGGRLLTIIPTGTGLPGASVESARPDPGHPITAEGAGPSGTAPAVISAFPAEGSPTPLRPWRPSALVAAKPSTDRPTEESAGRWVRERSTSGPSAFGAQPAEPKSQALSLEARGTESMTDVSPGLLRDLERSAESAQQAAQKEQARRVSQTAAAGMSGLALSGIVAWAVGRFSALPFWRTLDPIAWLNHPGKGEPSRRQGTASGNEQKKGKKL